MEWVHVTYGRPLLVFIFLFIIMDLNTYWESLWTIQNNIGSLNLTLASKLEALHQSKEWLEVEELKSQLALEQQKEEDAKQHIIDGMLANWIKSVDFVNQKVTVKQSAGSVNVVDETQIPALFIKEKITKSVDKVAIKNAIKEWKEVPGAEIVQSYSLVITPK